MGERVEPEDHMRIGDTERGETIDALRDAVGEGRLTLDEFAERAGATWEARTVEDLRAVVADLPPAQSPVRISVDPMVPPPPTRGQTVLAVMCGAERRGRWRVAKQVTAIALMGGVKLDLYDAELTAPITTIHAFALMGGVSIRVPEGISVQVDGFALMGGVDNRTRPPASKNGPVVRVIGYGLWGGINVSHRRRRKTADMATEIPHGSDRANGRHATTSQSEHRAPVPPTPMVAHEPSVPPVRTHENSPGLDGDTVTLLFTDIVDSTGMAERLGDQRWFGVLSAHNALVREQVSRHDGQEIKAQGDGFMVAFRSARRALLAAIAIQRALDGYRRGHPESPLRVRVGLHTGEVVADDGDLYGRNVILAARIAAAAEPDQVLASALTKQLAEAGGDLGFGPARTVALKGLTGDWPVHVVDWC